MNRLGSPASHGCVRLSRANAATLYALVQKDGVLNATVTLTGSSQVALARNPRPRANTAVARRDAAPPAIQFRRRSDRADAAAGHAGPGRAAGRAADTASGAGRRRLHLSGRRLFQRGALSGAAQPARSMARRSIRASSITMIAAMRRNTRRRAITSRGSILSAARAVHLSGLTRFIPRSAETKEAANRGGLRSCRRDMLSSDRCRCRR